jgi:hypothetical protein
MFHRGLIVFERRVKDLCEKKVLLAMTNRRERTILGLGRYAVAGSVSRGVPIGVCPSFNLLDVKRHQRTFDTDRRAVIR